MSVVTVQKRSAERSVVTHLDEVDSRAGVVDGPFRIWTAHPNTHYEDLGGAVLDDRWMISHEGTRSPMVRTKSWLLRAITASNAILSPPLWHWSLVREARIHRSVWKRIS